MPVWKEVPYPRPPMWDVFLAKAAEEYTPLMILGANLDDTPMWIRLPDPAFLAAAAGVDPFIDALDEAKN